MANKEQIRFSLNFAASSIIINDVVYSLASLLFLLLNSFLLRVLLAFLYPCEVGRFLIVMYTGAMPQYAPVYDHSLSLSFFKGAGSFSQSMYVYASLMCVGARTAPLSWWCSRRQVTEKDVLHFYDAHIEHRPIGRQAPAVVDILNRNSGFFKKDGIIKKWLTVETRTCCLFSFWIINFHFKKREKQIYTSSLILTQMR